MKTIGVFSIIFAAWSAVTLCWALTFGDFTFRSFCTVFLLLGSLYACWWSVWREDEELYYSIRRMKPPAKKKDRGYPS